MLGAAWVSLVVSGVEHKNLLMTAGLDQSLQQGLPACCTQCTLITQFDEFVVQPLFAYLSHHAELASCPEGMCCNHDGVLLYVWVKVGCSAKPVVGMGAARR